MFHYCRLDIYLQLESRARIFWRQSLGLGFDRNAKVLVSNFKTRVSQSRKVSNLPFYTPTCFIDINVVLILQ